MTPSRLDASVVTDRLDICANQLGDLEGIRDALLEWIRANPERIDRAI